MIDGGLFNPTRTVDEFSYRELEAAVDEHGVDALNALTAELAQLPGVTVYRVDDILTGPRLAVVRERLVPTITTLGDLPPRPWRSAFIPNNLRDLRDFADLRLRMPYSTGTPYTTNLNWFTTNL